MSDAKCQLCGEPMPPRSTDEVCWLLEMGGPSYLAIRELGGWDIYWTNDHNKAIRFCRREDADSAMMAIRQRQPDLFPACLSRPAQAVQHMFISPTPESTHG